MSNFAMQGLMTASIAMALINTNWSGPDLFSWRNNT